MGEKLFAQYLKDVKGQVSVFDLNGKKIDEIAFNDIGSVSGFYGSKNADTTFYKLTGFTNPGLIMMTTKQSKFFTPVKMEQKFPCLLCIKKA